MASLRDLLRSWRRRLKARLPYVRRREHRVLQKKYDELVAAVDGGTTAATDARLQFAKPLSPDLAGEVCIFVTHADEPRIKPHVPVHIACLIASGVHVILVVNTDLAAGRFEIDPALQAGASAIAFRENTGFDFGAWAHILALCRGGDGWTRLFLVNDSVVGPLDGRAFERLMARIRASPADVIGLTESLLPVRHLQSWFLVFGARALECGAVQRLCARVRNWPTKRQVIDIHESRLTALLEAEGLHCEALFPSLSGDPLNSDDTSLRWAELVASGMPYLKMRVIASHGDDPRIEVWLAALRDNAPGKVGLLGRRARIT